MFHYKFYFILERLLELKSNFFYFISLIKRYGKKYNFMKSMFQKTNIISK